MTDCFKERKGVSAAGLARFFVKDERGVISVMAAFSLVVVIAIAAVVIDTGALMLTRRGLQNATDAAALSAAQHLPNGATAAVVEALRENGYSEDDIDLVETGIYTADEATPASGRFAVASDPSDPLINAVRVTTKKQAATYFARALGLSSFNTVHTKATAATIATASFSAGTRVAQLDNGIANKLLGGLLGGNLSLSLIDYQALADTRITALSFLDALATRANVNAGTYADLLNTQVTVGQILNAGTDVLQNSSSGATGSISGAISALNTLFAQLPSGTTLKLGDMLSVPSIATRTIGSIGKGGDGSQFELYTLIAAAARTAGAGRQIDINTGLTLPITNTALQASVVVGAPMAQVMNGPVGASIHTAQVRIALTVQLLNLNILGILGTSISAPIYVEMAQGTATINAIPCKSNQMVTLGAQTGAVTARYGSATSGFASFPGAPTVSNVPLVNISVAGLTLPVTASGTSSVASGSGTADFSQTDIDEGNHRSVSSTNPDMLFPNLAGALKLTIGGSIPALLASVVNPVVNLVLSTLTGLLTAAVSTLSTPISNLLTTLGLQLGVMDMGVSGAKCGVPVLVG